MKISSKTCCSGWFGDQIDRINEGLGNVDTDVCADAVQGATADDVRAGVQQIEDFLRAIDNQDDERGIRARYEAWYRAVNGRRVSLAGGEVIADDVSSAQADFRKVEYAFGRRGEAVTEYIDRQLGLWFGRWCSHLP